MKTFLGEIDLNPVGFWRKNLFLVNLKKIYNKCVRKNYINIEEDAFLFKLLYKHIIQQKNIKNTVFVWNTHIGFIPLSSVDEVISENILLLNTQDYPYDNAIFVVPEQKIKLENEFLFFESSELNIKKAISDQSNLKDIKKIRIDPISLFDFPLVVFKKGSKYLYLLRKFDSKNFKHHLLYVKMISVSDPYYTRGKKRHFILLSDNNEFPSNDLLQDCVNIYNAFCCNLVLLSENQKFLKEFLKNLLTGNLYLSPYILKNISSKVIDISILLHPSFKENFLPIFNEILNNYNLKNINYKPFLKKFKQEFVKEIHSKDYIEKIVYNAFLKSVEVECEVKKIKKTPVALLATLALSQERLSELESKYKNILQFLKNLS